MSYSLPIRVYWEDTDAGGIVFYANYLKFMERARTEWLRSMGIGQRRLRDEAGGMFVVSETRLKYHRPARLDDGLVVTAELQQLGTASLIIAQRVMADPAGEPSTRSGVATDPEPLAAGNRHRLILCEGTIRIGWVDATSLRPARLPRQITGTLAALAGSMSQTPTL